MSAFAERQAALSRTPITLLVLRLDSCQRVFGQSPCLATGVPCYHTKVTCRYPAAYLIGTKPYRYVSTDAQVTELLYQHVVNHHFEVDTAGWYAGTDATISRATGAGEFYSGAAGMKIVTGGGYAYAGAICSTFPYMIPGQPYRVTARIKTSAGVAHVSFGAGGPWELDVSSDRTSWALVEGVFVPAAGDLSLWVWNASAATMYLDDVRIYGPSPSHGGPVRPYIKKATALPTEIKTSFTVNGRMTVECVNVPETTDVGADPYLDIRYGIPRYAAHFVKASGLALYRDSVNLGTSDWSVEAWVKINATTAGAGDCLMALRTNGGTEVFEFQSDANAGGLAFYLGGTAGWQACMVSGTPIPTGVWRHYLFTFTAGTKTVRAYVDGAYYGQLVYSGTVQTGAARLSLGARYGATGGGAYSPSDCDLAAVRLWSGRVLSADEAVALYYAGIGHTHRGLSSSLKTSLYASYDLGDETGVRADQSGNARPLTPTGTVTAVTGPASAKPAQPQGTHWKKLLARNPYYKGRAAEVYQGYLGLAENEFQQVWVGDLDNVVLAKETVKLEIVDLLKAMDKVYIPAKVDVKLVADIDASVTSITLTDVAAMKLCAPVQDMSVEAGAEFWDQGGGSAVNNGNARSGSWCLEFTDAAWRSNHTRQQVVAGDTVFVAAWAKSSSEADGVAKVGAAFFDANGGWLSTLYASGSVSPGVAYREVSGTITAPANAMAMQATVLIDGRTTGTWWVDDVLMFVSGKTYVRIKDEIIAVGSASLGNNQIAGCTRGALGSTAETHKAKDKVTGVRVFRADQGWNHLKAMLLYDAGMDAANVDTAAFDYWRDTPVTEVPLRATLIEPTKLSDVYFGLVDVLDCKSWVGENLQITIRRNCANLPGRTLRLLTDDGHIVSGSTSVDLNAKSRLSRYLLYWDYSILKKKDEEGSYARLDMAMDADSEGKSEYDEEAEKLVKTPWVYSDLGTEEALATFTQRHTMRRVWSQRDPTPLLLVAVERKDADLITGQYVRLTTDELETVDGDPLTATWEIVKREDKVATVSLMLQKCRPERIAFVADDTAPDYNHASEQQRNDYGYICENDGTIAGDAGYVNY